MADSGIIIPSGSGGLMRYNEEYESKIKLSPMHVVIIILIVVIGMAVIKLVL